MRPVSACLVVALSLAGCRAHQQASESADAGPLRYKVSYSINTATGGERCVVEFEGRAFPVYDTTESEPLYRFCRKEFPDLVPEGRWLTYWRVPYQGSNFAYDMPPGGSPMGPPYEFEFYEPAAIELCEEIREAGGRPWQDTRSALKQLYASANRPWPSIENEFRGLLGKWVLTKRGEVKEWKGPRFLSAREVHLLRDTLDRIDRPRSLAVKCVEGTLRSYLQLRTGGRE
ncbi:MAG: hypothetical protein ACYTKD_25265 [Planctomycetota bacterium]|jgi:hypothetical protein